MIVTKNPINFIHNFFKFPFEVRTSIENVDTTDYVGVITTSESVNRILSGNINVTDCFLLPSDFFEGIQLLLTDNEELLLAPVVEERIAFLETVVKKMLHKKGLPFIGVNYLPLGYKMAVCITHDIDHLSIWDHTRSFMVPKFMGTRFIEVLKRQRSLRNFSTTTIELSLYLLGVNRQMGDPWNNLDELMETEKDKEIHSTYFFSPSNGEPESLGIAYKLGAAKPFVEKLMENGFEIGVHGHDFRDVAGIKKELHRISVLTGGDCPPQGIRMHYLRFSAQETWSCLENVGYTYDSTYGYKQSIGFRAGTVRPYVVPNSRIIEIPLNIMDTTLFSPFYMGCNYDEGKMYTEAMIKLVKRHEGALTILIHQIHFSSNFEAVRRWAIWLMNLFYRDETCWKVTCARLANWHRHWHDLRISVNVQKEKLTVSLNHTMPEPLSIEIQNLETRQLTQISVPQNETIVMTTLNSQTKGRQRIKCEPWSIKEKNPLIIGGSTTE